MAHPLIPEILELARPVAESLRLEVVHAVFHTNQSPPSLRIDVRNLDGDTGLEDCERMSRAFELVLDESGLLPDAYVLEVSSPGIPEQLTTDREFISFKGFPICVTTHDPVEGQKENVGTLIRRDETHVHLNKKGRTVKIARAAIASVRLVDLA
jgi:ribosome maturation factor RimP